MWLPLITKSINLIHLNKKELMVPTRNSCCYIIPHCWPWAYIGPPPEKPTPPIPFGVIITGCMPATTGCCWACCCSNICCCICIVVVARNPLWPTEPATTPGFWPTFILPICPGADGKKPVWVGIASCSCGLWECVGLGVKKCVCVIGADMRGCWLGEWEKKFWFEGVCTWKEVWGWGWKKAAVEVGWLMIMEGCVEAVPQTSCLNGCWGGVPKNVGKVAERGGGFEDTAGCSGKGAGACWSRKVSMPIPVCVTIPEIKPALRLPLDIEIWSCVGCARLGAWYWSGSDESWPGPAKELRSSQTPPPDVGLLGALGLGWFANVILLTRDSGVLVFPDTARCGTLEIVAGGALATSGWLAGGVGGSGARNLVDDLDGPSLDATSADLSKNFLYWYFAFSERTISKKSMEFERNSSYNGYTAQSHCLSPSLQGWVVGDAVVHSDYKSHWS